MLAWGSMEKRKKRPARKAGLPNLSAHEEQMVRQIALADALRARPGLVLKRAVAAHAQQRTPRLRLRDQQALADVLRAEAVRPGRRRKYDDPFWREVENNFPQHRRAYKERRITGDENVLRELQITWLVTHRGLLRAKAETLIDSDSAEGTRLRAMRKTLQNRISAKRKPRR